MKVSEMKIENIAEYLRLDFETMSEQEIAELSAILASSKDFIRGYTGLSDDEIDKYESLTAVAFAKCQMQYDNRSDVVENDKLNPFFKNALDMRTKNFLPDKEVL